MSEKFSKYVTLKEVKKQGGKKPIYYFVATKEVIDRDGDIVIVKGIDTTNYESNPVVLFAHDIHRQPVGKVVDMKKTDNELIVGIEFANTEKGQDIEYLVSNGYMKTVSIRFIPKEIYSNNWPDSKPLSELQVDYPEIYSKFQNVLDNVFRIITKSELLEISIVPIPANPQATLIMISKGIDKVVTLCEDGHCKKEIEIPLSKDFIESVEKAYVKYSEHPKNMEKDTESSWDKNIAVESLRKWASKDGSGNKDTIDWTKYRKGFTWYDKKAIDNFTSYKYPHHWVKDGKFYVVWRGVATAMAYFMKYNKNLPEEDRKGVYNHLAEHYKKDFNKIPPEFKESGDYNIKELVEKGIDKDTLLEYIKFCNEEEIYSEFKSILEEGVEMKEKIEALEKEIKSLKEIIEKNQKQLDNLLSQLNEEQKSDVGSPSQSGEVEKSESTSEIVAKEKEDTQVSTEDVSSIVKQITEKLLKEIYGGK